jgi:hypothetical protein
MDDSEHDVLAYMTFSPQHPCTISPKATIRAAACAGARKCSHTPAATMAKAKPGKTSDKGRSKGADGEQREIESLKLIYGIPHAFPPIVRATICQQHRPE